MYSRARPVPDATARSRFTDKQTRQDRSRLDQVLQVTCTCACTCYLYLYLSQSSRFPLVCDAEQSAFLTEYDMVGVFHLKLKLPQATYTCQYVPSDFVYYTRTRLPSKQAINRFLLLPSIGFYRSRKHVRYVCTRHVCVCELLYPSQHSQQTPYSTGRPPPYRMFCLLVARQTRLKCM